MIDQHMFMFDVIVWALGGFLILLTVIVHYEAMLLISDRIIPLATKTLHDRKVVAIMMGFLILVHIIEIWIWALASMLVLLTPELGGLVSKHVGTFDDFLYFSAVNYTSLGDNNIIIEGPARLLTACETLVGIMMITWSASFTYLKMEALWKRTRK